MTPGTDRKAIASRRFLEVRARGLSRQLFARTFSESVPYYIVNEYPKSGATWIAQMLSSVTGIRFPRNRTITRSRSIVHGHFLSPRGLHNVLVIWRDPRDVLVSWYYHCYFANEHSNRALTVEMKARLPFADYHDIRSNLPHFINFVNRQPLTPRFTWAQFAQSWIDRPDVVYAKYEDMRARPVDELNRVLIQRFGIEARPEDLESVVAEHSFAAAKKRAQEAASADVEMSFVREGSLGGWRKSFNEESERLVEQYCGAQMSSLGYQ